MGRRGKQRAKQAKAAREIKYHAVATDFDQLERELSDGSRDSAAGGQTRSADSGDDAEPEVTAADPAASDDSEHDSRVSSQ